MCSGMFILCGKIPVTVLNLVYRQGKDSNIPINAQLINEGKTNLQWGDDFQMVECSGADAAAQIVKNIYLKEMLHESGQLFAGNDSNRY